MDAVVLAAGSSTRMGPGNEKQLARLGGKPMVVFAIERLLEHESIERIILTCRADRVDSMQELMGRYGLGDRVTAVVGGASRQESVSAGLAHVSTPRVLVHEAARPVITRELLERVISAEGVAVVPTVEIPFTVAVGSGGVMTAEIERNTLHNVQLPQAFDTQVLRDAHAYAAEHGERATEDAQLVFRRGHEVVFVDGLVENIKVTYPIDLTIAHTFIFGEGAPV